MILRFICISNLVYIQDYNYVIKHFKEAIPS